MRRQKSALADDEVRFVTDLQAALLDDAAPRSRLMLGVLGVVLVVAAIWASLAQVEEITRAEAVVIASSREQVIKSLDGGVVQRLHVREGDVVERGQVLVNIDPTRAEATYQETLMAERALHASVLRLRSEAYATGLDLQAVESHSPRLASEQRAAYDARRQALQKSIETLQKSVSLAQQEIQLTAPLVAKGLMSQVELLRMRRQENDLKVQMVERQDRYRHEAATELATLEREWIQVRESLPGLADVRNHTIITAPLRGTVKNIRVNTHAAVVQPGEAILEIVPLDERLLLEGRIKPADIAFLRPGLPAMAKVSAYDFNVYGGLSGVVQHVSADALEDEVGKAAGQSQATYYRVHVITDSAQLQSPAGPLPILPGMVATIDIRTGQKSLLDYLLKPIFKAREAFRER